MKFNSSHEAYLNVPPPPSHLAGVYRVPTFFFSILCWLWRRVSMWKMVSVLRKTNWFCSEKWDLHGEKQRLTSDNLFGLEWVDKSMGVLWTWGRNNSSRVGTVRKGTIEGMENWRQVTLKWTPPGLGPPHLCCAPENLSWPLHPADVYRNHPEPGESIVPVPVQKLVG